MKLANALPNGYVLRHYRIDRTIGGGGFSVVYRATDTENLQKVVIKEYLPADHARRGENGRVEFASEEANRSFQQGIKRFFDEAGALARINHPNIVRVRDFFRANDTVYLVMEYERGRDLRWFIKRHEGRLSERFIHTVFPRLLLGLGELHNNRLLHLDIKPANILIRAGGKPLLLDFGAARQVWVGTRREGPQTLTLGFAPIEQHRRGHLGPWTDLYAVGATLYACMTGKAPPPAPERVVKDRYKPAARMLARHYAWRLLEAVDWCLQLDQLQRPQSVPQLLDFLDAEPAAAAAQATGYLSRLALKLPWLKG